MVIIIKEVRADVMVVEVAELVIILYMVFLPVITHMGPTVPSA
jgi:hypothetical protein